MVNEKPAANEQVNRLRSLLQEQCAQWLTELVEDRGDLVAYIAPASLLPFVQTLRDKPTLRFDMLVDVTVIDWLDRRDERFELVYHFLSLPHGFRLRVKSPLPEQSCEVESLCGLYRAANFLEREAFDMYGVRFLNHEDLRRVLLYDEFEGYPLRKDYPLQGKQPRIPLRHPEVRNTAVDMQREPLVAINRRKRTLTSEGALPGEAGQHNLGSGSHGTAR